MALRSQAPWEWIRGRWVPHCQGIQQLVLCQREGKGNWKASPAGAWPHRLSAARKAPGSQGPWVGDAAPHREAESVFTLQVLERWSFLSALFPSRDVCRWFGPAPACLSSCLQPQLREAAPEPRPPGGSWLPRMDAECTACREARLLRERRDSPDACVYKAFLGNPKCATRTAELQLFSEARSASVLGTRLLCIG